MKKLFFILFVFFFMITTLKSQWDILNEGRDFKTIDFANDSVGWIAGGNKILKTEDGGTTWFEIKLSDDINIYEVDFVNENVGWIITGTNNAMAWYSLDTYFILKSEDGGHTWILQKTLPGVYLQDLHVVTESTVYISAFTGDFDNVIPKFIKSVDGGHSWTEIFRNEIRTNYQSIWFQDTNNGVFIGTEYSVGGYPPINAKILRTNDGGSTFEETIIPEYDQIFDLQIINDSTGYFSTGEGGWWLPERLCLTYDTLNSWTQLSNTNMCINSFSYVNDTTIFAVMNDDFDVKFMKSIDGGLTWNQKNSMGWFSSGTFYEGACKIYFRNEDDGYIAGGTRGSFILQTLNGGNEWEINNFDIPIEGIYFIDKFQGFVYGGGLGLFGNSWQKKFITTNSGNSWEIAHNNPPGFLRGLSFANNLIGLSLSYFYYDGFQIFKTANSGAGWYNVFENNRDSLGIYLEGYDIGFLDDNIAYIAGKFETDTSRGAAILGTNDAGENWDLVWRSPVNYYTDYELYSINTVGAKACAVGFNGLIVSSVGPDSFTVTSGITSLNLYNVFFSDAQHGWITGENSSFFKTIDGGQTWNQLPNFVYDINDMFFKDSLHGWVVGKDTTNDLGIILESYDGGDNWNTIIDNLSAELNALHFKDGYGWAAGDNGLILRTDYGATWIDQKTGHSYPSKYTLKQNYPNPFNPTTNIEFSIPKSEYITLTIYNLLGQEVTELVAKRLTQGNYKYTWDASGFASGVYLYKIEAGDPSTGSGQRFVESKKLLLLK